MRRPDWMKAIPHESNPYLDLSTVQAIVWWEIRRPLFNFYLFTIGLLSVIVMKLLLDRFDSAAALTNAELISGTFFYGVGANVAYAFGWIAELLWRRSDPMEARHKAVDLYWRGLKLFCLLTTLPVWFALFRCLQHVA
jgi:hypothetical protein